MIINIKLEIDTEKQQDSELGEILVDLLSSLKEKLEREEDK